MTRDSVCQQPRGAAIGSSSSSSASAGHQCLATSAWPLVPGHQRLAASDWSPGTSRTSRSAPPAPRRLLTVPSPPASLLPSPTPLVHQNTEVVKAPLWDVAAQGPTAFPTNTAYVQVRPGG